MNLKEMPKVELHLHLDGSVRIQTAEELLNKNNLKSEMVAPKKCVDLKEYLTKFSIPIKIMQSKENLIRIARELALDLKNENVIYAEIRFAPINHISNLTLDEVVESVLFGLNEVDIKTNLILCLMRNSSIEDNIKIISLAHKFLNKGVVGIDLAGDEANYKTEKFSTLFDVVNTYNIPITIHAGEADGPESIKNAIEFNANRIGHGINAIEDQETIDIIKKNNILLEVCPTSNVQTNAVNKYENHPIKKLIDLGCKVSINTDNRTVSNITLTREYELLINKLKLTFEDIKQANINAIESSFLPQKEKEELINLYLKSIN